MCSAQFHCGSEPARDGGESACMDAGCEGPFAGKPASTGSVVGHQSCVQRNSTVGASLLAMAVDQLAWMLDVKAPSRASSLHRVCRWPSIMCSAQFHCGSELARDGGGSACMDAGCEGPFAGKLAPQGLSVAINHVFSAGPLWERACSRWRQQGRHPSRHRHPIAPPFPCAHWSSTPAPGYPGPESPICA